MVPATVCDQQQLPSQRSPAPQQNTTQIHVTPVVVSPSVSQQAQQPAAVYAGQVGIVAALTKAYADWYYSQYSPSSQQQNPYAYTCYTPPTASNPSSQLTGTSGSSSPVRQTSAPVTSPAPTNTYQQQNGYFGAGSNSYLGMSGMNLGLGLTHGGVNSLIGMQNGGYSQPTLAAFHQQLQDQYRGYAAQVQQQQQQQQQTQESKEGATV
jgi:hypothetical protein